MSAPDDTDIKVIRVIQQGIPFGGNRYVDVVADPVALTTFPFYNPSSLSNGGVVAIPAPGVGYVVLVTGLRFSSSAGDPWGNAGNLHGYYNSGDGAIDAINSLPLGPVLGNSGNVASFGQQFPYEYIFDPSNLQYYPIENTPVIICIQDDITSGGIGTRSLLVRLYYEIVKITPAALSNAGTFFHITVINQGAKKITVNGDAHTLTGSISVVGSTGNNGTYTIVSATFVTDHTDIIVVQSIPSATANGWVKL